MKVIGTRREASMAEEASGALLVEGARLNEAVAALTRTTFIPKGVYRFKSHEDANRHERDCLARGMGLRIAERG